MRAPSSASSPALALQAEIDPDDVPTQTIKHVERLDFAYAKELSCTIRQVSRAQLDGESSAPASAHAGAEDLADRLVHGTQNMVVTSGRFGGDVVFCGHGAGGHRRRSPW